MFPEKVSRVDDVKKNEDKNRCQELLESAEVMKFSYRVEKHHLNVSKPFHRGSELDESTVNMNVYDKHLPSEPDLRYLCIHIYIHYTRERKRERDNKLKL